MKNILILFILAVTVINYPNPFNPKAGQITTIECTSDSSYAAKLFIYDMAARLMHSSVFNLTASAANTTSWNGYADNNQKAGNGIYLYQVITTSGQRLAKGKIWVINQ